MQYCPYLKGAPIKKYNKRSKLRKPENLMIINLMKKWMVDNSKSFMIGDKKSDQQAAKKSKLYFEYCYNSFYDQLKKNINKKLNKNKFDILIF